MAIIDFTASSILFTPGRAACVGPLAIVLHEYGSGIEMLDLEMGYCPRPRPAQSPGCHTSFHYGVGGNVIHQYVDITDTAWGFGVQAPTCPVPPCPPSPCESCTGLTVDQYNPDIDGNPPVLPAFVAGPDGTANSCVLHVAVANSLNRDPNNCCLFLSDPRQYRAFVNSLCEIFEASGLVPSQTTLLVHCGELPCLDIDQLVLDILECLAAPEPVLPPCNCVPVLAEFAGNIASNDDGLLIDGRTQVVSNAPTASNVTAEVDATLYIYRGVGAGSFTLVAPATANDLNRVIIKNRSASVLTVVGDIEGGNITLAGTGVYPFGNPGGEAAELIYDFTAGEWVVI